MTQHTHRNTPPRSFSRAAGSKPKLWIAFHIVSPWKLGRRRNAILCRLFVVIASLCRSPDSSARWGGGVSHLLSIGESCPRRFEQLCRVRLDCYACPNPHRGVKICVFSLPTGGPPQLARGSSYEQHEGCGAHEAVAGCTDLIRGRDMADDHLIVSRGRPLPSTSVGVGLFLASGSGHQRARNENFGCQWCLHSLPLRNVCQQHFNSGSRQVA